MRAMILSADAKRDLEGIWVYIASDNFDAADKVRREIEIEIQKLVEHPGLDWCEGNIYSKNPDSPIVDKMVAVAKALNAKVQGDDGEVYLGGGVGNYIPPE